jgi:hypothetical protein
MAHRLALTIVIFYLFCTASAAQQEPPTTTPDAPSSNTKVQTEQKENPLESGVALFGLLQRKSIVFPTLATDKGQLDSWEKFKLAANNSVSLATVGAALAGSAFGQAINSPEGYGQGGEGYAKRFGADMARSASANMFGVFLISSIMHEDPRFYVKKHLTFKQSVKYAAVRVFYTRSDSGDQVVNYGGLLGPLAAEGLANTYYPEGNRDFSSTMIRYASDEGWTFAGNILRQYWPKINRKLRLVPPPPTPNPK